MPETKVILSRLGKGDIVRLRQSAAEAQGLEDRWKSAFLNYLQSCSRELVYFLERDDEMPDLSGLDFTNLVMGSYFDVMKVAAETANSHLELLHDPSRHFAKQKGLQLPRSLGSIRELYDLWQTKGYVPKHQQVLADKIKATYLKKVQDVWERYSGDWRNGKNGVVEDLKAEMQQAARVGYSRASTIVETETTNHYNRVRREIYDQSPDVVAYLFVAVRDHATTKWCKSRNGLVYHRGDPHLILETPAIHWNCRSEILPLTRFNPRHLALINDPSLDRRNNRCEPLPKGWRAA